MLAMDCTVSTAVTNAVRCNPVVSYSAKPPTDFDLFTFHHLSLI